ncbi:hypothetical protein CBM2589_A10170 [Cupriavidus taiwanensis]|uniref:Uncharacterized protein n=1 Tax=Cupriavidus taiwanensis TaxID=164546 RepID=A0A975X572_9BURK|nr:hypothetical protein CBM2589_A10170 [Cupriavidus taiwanensis]
MTIVKFALPCPTTPFDLSPQERYRQYTGLDVCLKAPLPSKEFHANQRHLCLSRHDAQREAFSFSQKHCASICSRGHACDGVREGNRPWQGSTP